ncbi:uncharacterized protein MYCGRDRAFT_108890, partial [Zymoseptoria tritici IPO323]
MVLESQSQNVRHVQCPEGTTPSWLRQGTWRDWQCRSILWPPSSASTRALMARRGHRRTVHRTETPRTTQQCDIDTTTAFAVPTACSTCVPDSGSVRRCRRASVRTECRTEMECETRGFIKWLSPIYM